MIRNHMGIVRHMDDLGRFVIPKELRRTLDINEGDPLEILATTDGLVLRKYRPRPQVTLDEIMDEMLSLHIEVPAMDPEADKAADAEIRNHMRNVLLKHFYQ